MTGHTRGGFWASIDRARLLAWAVGALAAVAGILWTAFAEPRITDKIECRVRPIEDAVTFQTYLLMEHMDSTQIRSATTKYLQFERGRPKR